MKRKEFIKTSTGLLAASALPFSAMASTTRLSNEKQSNNMNAKKVILKKSLVYGMIDEDLSMTDKFKLVKDLGFDGVELDSPNDFNTNEVLEAKEKSGIELPSVINKDHWSKPLSDPDPDVRAACIKSVATSLQDMKDYGGDTVLVVPGVVNDKVSYEKAYFQSQASIREIIPYAEKTGVQIALENVWNNFILSPLEAKRFIDEINHPLVGWYFDVGNILRYGWPEHWIETLQSRIKKLHLKEYSKEIMNDQGLWKGFEVELMEGDNNWPVVIKAINDINYKGEWITAEVDGGDRKRLLDVSQRMDKIING